MLTLANMLDQLLGLSRVSLGDPQAELGWRWPLPLWAWVLIAGAAAVIAVYSYRHLLGARWMRAALATVRVLLLLTIVALLAGPMLIIRREKVEPDYLIVLVDQSLSMSIRDMLGPRDDALVSRHDALRAALAGQADVFGEQRLGADRRILWLGFDSDVVDLGPPPEVAAALDGEDGQANGGPDAAPPTNEAPWAAPLGQRTALRTAIEQALRRVSGQPVSGMVLLTDARTNQSTGSELVQRLQQQGVGVFGVPLGSEDLQLDLAINRVDAPERAFINDAVPVSVWLDQYPSGRDIDPERVRVRLTDAQTGELLAERTAADAALDEPVRLTTRSDVAGPVQWRVEVIYDAPAGPRRELVLDNNLAVVDVELVDRPLAVLYIEGYPRWEYRYLKNLLVREESLKSSILLLSADRGFAQEGDLPITRMPGTAEEIEPYDVVVIGDVPAGYFSDEQLELLRDQVAIKGKGLLWIGGAEDTPRSYEASALAPLLPMQSIASVGRLDPAAGPVLLRPTPLASALQVLQLVTDDPRETWPSHLPPVYWVQDLGELKASAEVIGVGRSLKDARAWPLVTRLRYGAGQVIYVATDETWRYRYGRGEFYFEQFWVQLVRMLARSTLDNQQQRASFSVSSRRIEIDQPVVIELRTDDELLTERELPRLDVTVMRDDEQGRPQSVEQLELVLQRSSGDEADEGATRAGLTYRAVWRPALPGRLRLRVSDPAFDDLGLVQNVEVVPPDDELRLPAPDPERLATLAAETGGAVIPLAELDRLVELVPNRARRTPDDISEPLWNSYLALLLVLGLLTTEWIGRKVIRLA